jgi:quinoprotein glucose dehydrogenase
VTASGLTFIAATEYAHLRAFDSETGKLLWQTELPASAQADTANSGQSSAMQL